MPTVRLESRSHWRRYQEKYEDVQYIVPSSPDIFGGLITSWSLTLHKHRAWELDWWVSRCLRTPVGAQERMKALICDPFRCVHTYIHECLSAFHCHLRWFVGWHDVPLLPHAETSLSSWVCSTDSVLSEREAEGFGREGIPYCSISHWGGICYKGGGRGRCVWR